MQPSNNNSISLLFFIFHFLFLYTPASNSTGDFKITAEQLSLLLRFSLISEFYISNYEKLPIKQYCKDKKNTTWVYLNGGRKGVAISFRADINPPMVHDKLISSHSVYALLSTYTVEELHPYDLSVTSFEDSERNYLDKDDIRRHFSDADPTLAQSKKAYALLKATFNRDSLIQNLNEAESEIYISDDEIMAKYIIDKKIQPESVKDAEDMKWAPPNEADEFPGGYYYIKAFKSFNEASQEHFNKQN